MAFSSFATENHFSDGDMLNVELTEAIKALPVEREVQLEYKHKNRLDLMSYDYYGCTELWWFIAIYNNINDVMCMQQDMRISLPSIDGITRLLNNHLLEV